MTTKRADLLTRVPSGLRAATALGAVLLAGFLSLTTASAAANAGQRCGRVAVAKRHASAKVLVIRGPAACVIARRLIADAFTAEASRHYDFLDPTYGIGWRVDGWRCTTGLADTQTFCTRGHDRTDGSLRSDDGWNF